MSLTKLKSIKVLIIGDAIIDQYHYTETQGKSSKEPIVVHRYRGEESFAGGTLATANNIAALSDKVTLVTLLGKSQTHETFIRKHLRSAISPKFFYQPGANTIIKRRFVDEFTRQKLFQVSYMSDTVVSTGVEKRILRYLRTIISDYDLVVVNDFGHGLLTKKIVRLIVHKAK
jgi:bifunctional ADP-heptose synthase (sugar kinase/adenylyltransferase)